MQDIPNRFLPEGLWLEVKPEQTPASVSLEIEPVLIELGLSECVHLDTRSLSGQQYLCISLHADAFSAVCPGFDVRHERWRFPAGANPARRNCSSRKQSEQTWR
jgi:hypothetical protein